MKKCLPTYWTNHKGPLSLIRGGYGRKQIALVLVVVPMVQ